MSEEAAPNLLRGTNDRQPNGPPGTFLTNGALSSLMFKTLVTIADICLSHIPVCSFVQRDSFCAALNLIFFFPSCVQSFLPLFLSPCQVLFFFASHTKSHSDITHSN